MAGVSTGEASGKREVDRPINMVPFIDLLMVILSFLLITAVWSSLARMSASAALPSSKSSIVRVEEPSVLHVWVSDKEKNFVLQWQTGNKTDDIATVDMTTDAAGRYEALELAVKKAYHAGQGQERLHVVGDNLVYAAAEASSQPGVNPAILHVANGFAFREVVKVIDAISATRRFVCSYPKPTCCGKPTGVGGKSSDGCTTAAENVAAFNITFSAN